MVRNAAMPRHQGLARQQLEHQAPCQARQHSVMQRDDSPAAGNPKLQVFHQGTKEAAQHTINVGGHGAAPGGHPKDDVATSLK